MERIKLFKRIFLLILPAILISGCLEDESKELKDQERRQLNQYLEENDITVQPTASGLYFIELEEGTGRQAQMGDLADIDYKAQMVDGTMIYTSFEEVARDHDIFSENVLYGPIRLQIGATGIPGLEEGLQMMKEGGKAIMIMPSDINGYGSNNLGPAGPYTTHIYEVHLVNAFDDPKVFQDSMIKVYLAEHEYDSVLVTETGLHYIELVEGEGDSLQNNDLVKLWYTGSFLDGRVFESNRNGDMAIFTMPAMNYIPGWDEALRYMQKGTQARVILPYHLAYGPYGSYPKIPPYMTLVFDFEIFDVTPGK